MLAEPTGGDQPGPAGFRARSTRASWRGSVRHPERQPVDRSRPVLHGVCFAQAAAVRRYGSRAKRDCALRTHAPNPATFDSQLIEEQECGGFERILDESGLKLALVRQVPFPAQRRRIGSGTLRLGSRNQRCGLLTQKARLLKSLSCLPSQGTPSRGTASACCAANEGNRRHASHEGRIARRASRTILRSGGGSTG